MQLVRALALRLQLAQASPLIPLHIAGVQNAMSNIPSRSFGSDPRWTCNTHSDLCSLFNKKIPLPQQASWTVFQPSSAICTRVISILQTSPFTMDEWRRLPPIGRNIGPVGLPTSQLWEWTHIYRKQPTLDAHDSLLDSLPECAQDSTGEKVKLQLAQSIARSRPLARRSRWPEE